MKVSIGFAAGGIGLYLLLCVLGGSGGVISTDGLKREGYGGEQQRYQILVEAEGVGEEATVELPMEVLVSPQSYSREEAEVLFEMVMEQMEERIRGENPSLMEVSENLYLPKYLDDCGVRLRWYSAELDILGTDGTVASETEAETMVTLRVQLSVGEYREDYEMAVRVIPREKSSLEEFAAGLKKELERLDEGQKQSEYLRLPSEYEGRTLRYLEQERGDYAALPILGILMSVIWPARRQAEQRKKEKKREQELLLDYAEVVSKLMVFAGAGMTVRNAWERMVLDYERGGDQGKKKRERIVYEEMRYAYYQMKNGISEGKAYQEFGRRCRLQPYLKLSSLLEQNQKTGTKDLRRILQAEMTDAFELRKNLALRMGEEAGTKLLVPLFFMLGIVMVMIMVPAMMTMS